MIRSVTMPTLRGVFIWIFVVGLLTCLFLTPNESKAESQSIRIGVLANRGEAKCLEEWTPTAEYLTARLPGYLFSVVPLGFSAIDGAVARDEVDFVVTNPIVYVNLEVKYNVMRIATMRTNALGKPMVQFGGVIFTQAGRGDITKLQDLRGKTFAAVDKDSFGGWVACLDELVRAGIDPENDFRQFTFAKTQDAVVSAVRNKTVDAGTVRTDVLERMAATGEISLDEFKVLPPVTPDPLNSQFQFVLSTRLYPEWAMAITTHVPEELASKVSALLLTMPIDATPAKAVQGAGWTVPLDYTGILEVMKRHNLGVFQDFGKVSIFQFIQQRPFSVVMFLLVGLMMLLVAIYFRHTSRQLAASKDKLESELLARKQAEAGLILLENQYQELIERAPIGIFQSTPQGRYIFGNSRLAEMYGYDSAQQLMDSVLDIRTQTYVDPDGCDRLRMVLEQGPLDRHEVQRRRKDGSVIWVSLSMRAVRDKTGKINHYEGFARDITKRKQAEEALQESERTQRLIMESVDAGIVLIDPQSHVV